MHMEDDHKREDENGYEENEWQWWDDCNRI